MREFTPLPKTVQLERSTTPAKKAKQERKKGQEAEKKAIAELCKQIGREPGRGDRQNNQRRKGGGLGIADIVVKGLDTWHKESKAEKNYRFAAYWKQLDEDAPKNKHKVLIYTQEDGRQFIQFEVKSLMNVAQDVVLAAGFDII